MSPIKGSSPTTSGLAIVLSANLCINSIFFSVPCTGKIEKGKFFLIFAGYLCENLKLTMLNHLIKYWQERMQHGKHAGEQ